MVRWLFFVWALLATVGMLLAALRLFGFGNGPYGDASILFGWAALIGMPAGLIVAALTIAQSRHISRLVVAVQNSPAVLSAILYVGVALT
jgi:hypothetical protein